MATGELNSIGDQRVTNAMLLYRMTELEKILRTWHDDDCRKHDELAKRVNILEREGDVRGTKLTKMERAVDEHDKAIDDLSTKTAWWNGANSFLAVIAGLLGLTK